MAIISNEVSRSPLGREGKIAALSVVGIALYLVFRFLIPSLLPYASYPLYAVLGIGGTVLVFELLRKVVVFEFSSDLLAGISIVTSVILGEYLAGSIVVLMLSGGEALENYAIRTASQVLAALAKRAPTTAHRKSGVKIEDIGVEAISVGDILIVFPHEICPVDGEVIEGRGEADEAFLTGEPFLISKAPGSGVLSGSINGDSSLTIRAAKLAVDSRYEMIMRVMRESEQKRPRIRRIADELGAWYTPLAVCIALLAWVITGEAVRFLAVLVIATPCPLLLAIPVAIIGSISLCARQGILIKNPVVLEQLGECKTMIFDKTGTLTYGRPTLMEQTAFNNQDPKEVLKYAASLERYSKHPLASAILEEAKKEKLELLEVKQISELKGEGLEGRVDSVEVIITSRKRLADFSLDPSLLPKGEGLECVILTNRKLAAHYRFRDTPREESKRFVGHLGRKHGFTKTMIVSGDRQDEVKYLADLVGITEIYADQSPEQKVAIVEKERRLAKTVFLGDGINDAPALIAATVGIAFGKNSDITAEAAGAVVMDNTFEKVDEFLHISKRMRRIALESAVGGMALSILGMFIAAYGYLPPVAGALTQEVIDVLAILNSIRAAWKPSHLSDSPFYTK